MIHHAKSLDFNMCILSPQFWEKHQCLRKHMVASSSVWRVLILVNDLHDIVQVATFISDWKIGASGGSCEFPAGNCNETQEISGTEKGCQRRGIPLITIHYAPFLGNTFSTDARPVSHQWNMALMLFGFTFCGTWSSCQHPGKIYSYL